MPQQSQQSQEIVRFEHVSMQYPGALANDDVSLAIQKGEVFALVGENGAGKSTLMNLLYGLQKPTLGDIYVKGEHVPPGYDPQRAMALGVGMVHQHFKLVPSFTVAQNIALCHEPTRRGFLYDMRAANDAVVKLVERFGLDVTPTDVVGELSVGLQQRVEILKALHFGADVLILDEPTAVLTPQETDELLAVIRRIVADEGMTVVLITHKLGEVMQISDRVGVMRRGKLVAVVDTASTDERKLAARMVGRDVIFDDIARLPARAEDVLCVRDLEALDDRGLPAVRGVSFTLRAGEILGVCGVEGNGQRELTECIMGMRPQTGGQVLLRGEDISRLTPRGIRARGVSYVPEDRIGTGMSEKATVAENLLLGKQRTTEFTRFRVHLRKRRVRAYAEKLSREFDVRSGGVDSLGRELSGGNMQKMIIAREFSFGAPVLIISQPTRGVDIGAIDFIHERIVQKRNDGCAILLVSADLDELFRLSDRMVTIFEGMLTGEFAAGEIDRQGIGYYMTGGREAKA